MKIYRTGFFLRAAAVLAAALFALLTALPSYADDPVMTNIEIICSDASLEGAVRRIATERLSRIGGVAITPRLEDASVIVSFYLIKETDPSGKPSGRIFYSFAYGMVDLDLVGNTLVALPRFIDHRPVITAADKLDRDITDNIRTVRDSLF